MAAQPNNRCTRARSVTSISYNISVGDGRVFRTQLGGSPVPSSPANASATRAGECLGKGRGTPKSSNKLAPRGQASCHLKVLTTIERSWQEELAVSRRDVPHGRGTEAVLSLAVVSAVTCCVCLHLVDLTQAVQCTAFVPGNGTACPHLLHANCITTNTLVCPCTGLTKQCPCKPPEPPLARVTSLTAVSNPSSSSSSSGPTPPVPAA